MILNFVKGLSIWGGVVHVQELRGHTHDSYFSSPLWYFARVVIGHGLIIGGLCFLWVYHVSKSKKDMLLFVVQVDMLRRKSSSHHVENK